MGKKLAIKGHPTRGKEVIELLEMMGGKNTAYQGTDINVIYTIDDKGIIRSLFFNDSVLMKMEYNIFSLEEFLEKYPFKVGDKVVYTKYGDNCDDYPVTIESMKWTGTTIEYTFNDCVTCLAKDLKMWNSNDIYLKIEKNTDMNIEFDLTKYSYNVKDGKLVISEKKPKYPKLTNLTECKEILGEKDIYQSVSGYKGELLTNFQRLLIFRNAYWKIAGEEMGLDKPWKPDWLDEKTKYGIRTYQNTVIKDNVIRSNCILVFPTPEIRDTFYENFKDLIEECKELL